MIRRTVAVAAVAAVAVEAKKWINIDPMKTKLQGITDATFTSVIQKSAQPLTVSTVLYYSSSTRSEQSSVDLFDQVAEKVQGWFPVTAMDCDEFKKHCDRQGVKQTPVVKVYPKSPMPGYTYAGKMDADSIVKHLTKQIPGDKIASLTKDEFDALYNTASTKLKVVIFGQKERAPLMLKALSTDTVFHRTVQFYYVDATKQTDIVARAGATDKKTILMFRAAKPAWFTNKDRSYKKIYEWINTYSESGNGDSVKGADGKEAEVAEMEMKVERLRELTGKSSKDLCFGQKSVCAVFLSNGPITDKQIDDMLAWENKFAASSERAIKFSWMWMDISEESKFREIFQAQENKYAEREDRAAETLAYPTLILVKPPKRKREESTLSYVALGNNAPVTAATVGALVEKVQSGAMYVRAPLPNFMPRQKKAAADKGRQEL